MIAEKLNFLYYFKTETAIPAHSSVGRALNNPPIAQLVEQIPLKDKVVGSIPTGRNLN